MSHDLKDFVRMEMGAFGLSTPEDFVVTVHAEMYAGGKSTETVLGLGQNWANSWADYYRIHATVILDDGSEFHLERFTDYGVTEMYTLERKGN
jgi:hypothetical protein